MKLSRETDLGERREKFPAGHQQRAHDEPASGGAFLRARRQQFVKMLGTIIEFHAHINPPMRAPGDEVLRDARTGMVPRVSRPEDCLIGGGAMGELMRAKDWSSTALGPVRSWPQSLRTSVSICLGSSFPMMIAWGPELFMLYNDSYLPVLGTQKHPGALGGPLLGCFPEIRHLLGPMFGGVLRTGHPVGAEDMMFPLERNGYVEETYFVFSYSPIRDESGGVGGVLTTCTETTHRVLGERRLKTLSVLADRATYAKTAEEAMQEAAATFEPAEFPFALLYLAEADGRRARLVAASGLARESPAAPAFVHLQDDAGELWPLGDVARTGSEQLVRDLGQRVGDLPGGPWPEPSEQALVLPVARPGASTYGFLVAGVSPRRALDEGYRGYFRLVAAHIATAVANARRHEEERHRAESLAEIDRAKTAFFSNVSHEFRTPLTLLLGPLEDLLAGLRGPLTSVARQELEAMQRNALRLSRLVNTLLEFARIEAGRAEAVYEPIDLAALTRELAGVFRSAVERAGLRLIVACPPLPEPVYVDPLMWEKIVMNLLSNAFKFTLEGEIKVALHDRGELIELEVSDTGTGIPGHELPQLFQRFHRVQGARGRSHEGTGIGLALVQDLIRLHGGAISVESEPERGSSFRASVRKGTAHLSADRIRAERPGQPVPVAGGVFVAEALRWLPVEGDERLLEADAGAVRSALVSGVDMPSASATAGARILIVDDNADLRDYLRRILGRHWELSVAGDGRQALEEATQHCPDLVIADVMMPVMNGFELLRALRADERTRHVPVIMLSARAEEQARLEGFEAGVDDYLTKPFSARELVARVACQLVLSRGRRALEEQRAMLYSLFMQAPTPICILRGPDHVIEVANSFCCEVWGREQQSLIGRRLCEALPELEAQVFTGLLDQVLRTGEPHVGKETPAQLYFGEERRTVYFNFVYSPLRGIGGQVEGVLVIAFDVTDEIRARDELTNTVHFSEMFSGILGHDLRNPLSAIMTAAQLLLMRHGADPKVAGPATRIVSSGARMAKMVDQLLDFTRIRLAGGLGLEPKRSDLADIVLAVVNEIEGSSPGWRVKIQALGDTTGTWDGDRLAQVVSNLAGNAAQHGTPGAEMVVRLDGREPGSVSLSFENQGVIPAELLPELFDPFRGTRLRGRARGLGLGLFITREIVTAHGGQVSVESCAEHGTRFTVKLPRAVSARGTAGLRQGAGSVLSLRPEAPASASDSA